jgi:hypothetical protein
MSKPRLLASSSDQAGIVQQISRFFGGSQISLLPDGSDRFAIHNRNGLIADCWVVISKGRYRFESKY